VFKKIHIFNFLYISILFSINIKIKFGSYVSYTVYDTAFIINVIKYLITDGMYKIEAQLKLPILATKNTLN